MELLDSEAVGQIKVFAAGREETEEVEEDEAFEDEAEM